MSDAVINGMPRTERLAGLIAGFGSDALPRDVRERTLEMVLDGTGALLQRSPRSGAGCG